jgi:hypothetical protein
MDFAPLQSLPSSTFSASAQWLPLPSFRYRLHRSTTATPIPPRVPRVAPFMGFRPLQRYQHRESFLQLE